MEKKNVFVCSLEPLQIFFLQFIARKNPKTNLKNSFPSINANLLQEMRIFVGLNVVQRQYCNSKAATYIQRHTQQKKKPVQTPACSDCGCDCGRNVIYLKCNMSLACIAVDIIKLKFNSKPLAFYTRVVCSRRVCRFVYKCALH